MSSIDVKISPRSLGMTWPNATPSLDGVLDWTRKHTQVDCPTDVYLVHVGGASPIPASDTGDSPETTRTSHPRPSF